MDIISQKVENMYGDLTKKKFFQVSTCNKIDSRSYSHRRKFTHDCVHDCLAL